MSRKNRPFDPRQLQQPGGIPLFGGAPQTMPTERQLKEMELNATLKNIANVASNVFVTLVQSDRERLIQQMEGNQLPTADLQFLSKLAIYAGKVFSEEVTMFIEEQVKSNEQG